MSQKPVLGVEITGSGIALPEKSYTNEELIVLHAWDSNHEWIKKRAGIESRFIANDEETIVSLGATAVLNALESAGLSPDVPINSLFLGSTSSSTHRLVAGSHPGIHRLVSDQGYKVRHSEETNSACTSFMIALLNAYRHFDGDNDKNYKSVVVGSEKLSTITDYSDRSTGILFGDGAGAMVLERTKRDCGLLGASSSIDSELEEHLICNYRGSIKMDVRKVYTAAVDLVTESCSKTMGEAGVTADEISLTVPHQANIRIIEAAARRLSLNMDKMEVSIDRHGNTSSASVPLALNEAVTAKRIERGQNLMLVAFGGGMTVASAIVRW